MLILLLLLAVIPAVAVILDKGSGPWSGSGWQAGSVWGWGWR